MLGNMLSTKIVCSHSKLRNSKWCWIKEIKKIKEGAETQLRGQKSKTELPEVLASNCVSKITVITVKITVKLLSSLFHRMQVTR